MAAPPTTENPCPKAKLLAGSLHCPCHGIHGRITVRKPAKTSRRVAHLTEEQKTEIREQFLEGISTTALAARFRCNKKRITEICQGLAPSRPSFTQEQVDEIRSLFDQGISVSELRKKFHCEGKRIHAALGTEPKKYKPKLTGEEQDEIRSAHEAGESISSLGRRFERDRWVIYGALGKELGGRIDCSSTLLFAGETFLCHMKDHAGSPHRTTWRDGEGTQYRMEWK